jgi:hypothetical protein
MLGLLSHTRISYGDGVAQQVLLRCCSIFREPALSAEDSFVVPATVFDMTVTRLPRDQEGEY